MNKRGTPRSSSSSCNPLKPDIFHPESLWDVGFEAAEMKSEV